MTAHTLGRVAVQGAGAILVVVAVADVFMAVLYAQVGRSVASENFAKHPQASGAISSNYRRKICVKIGRES